MARPFGLGTIPIQFDAILVRVAQIQRFAHAMIARAIERNARSEHPMQRIGQRCTRGIQDRGVK